MGQERRKGGCEKTHNWVQETIYICERGEKVGKPEAERKNSKDEGCEKQEGEEGDKGIVEGGVLPNRTLLHMHIMMHMQRRATEATVVVYLCSDSFVGLHHTDILRARLHGRQMHLTSGTAAYCVLH